MRKSEFTLDGLTKVCIVTVCIFLSVYTLHFARDIFLPLALSLLLAVVLYPLVRLMSRAGIPAPIGAVLTVAAIILLVVALLDRVMPSAELWSYRLPIILRQIELKLGGIRDSIADARQMAEELVLLANRPRDGEEEAATIVVERTGLDLSFASDIQFVAALLLIIPFLVAFMLAFGPRLMESIAAALSDEEQRTRFRNTLHGIAVNIGNYYQTVGIINVCLGVTTWGLMTLLEMPAPVLWGVMAAVMNFIPYIGPLITTVTIGAVSLVSFYDWTAILLPPLLHFTVNAIEGQVITPVVVGRRLTLNPLLVLVFILFWGWLWGLVGALLAVPILAALKVIFGEVEGLRRWQPIFGGDPKT